MTRRGFLGLLGGLCAVAVAIKLPETMTDAMAHKLSEWRTDPATGAQSRLSLAA